MRSQLDEAVERFEKELLQRLYPLYPSSRKLAAYLKTSHTRIADKLRKFGIVGALRRRINFSRC